MSRLDHPAGSMRVGSAFLAVAIAGAALAVGSVHTTTLCVVAAVLTVSFVVLWWPASPTRTRQAATILLVAGIGLTAYTALQCVPMPIGVLSALAPHNADVWSRALRPLRAQGPAWAPISLDPVATHVELLKGICYLLAFLAALQVGARRRGAAFLSAVVIFTAVILAVAALLHPAFGARALFGVYEPGPDISERHIAPLMNPNNLAGYLNIGVCLAAAAFFDLETRSLRPIAATVCVFLIAVQIWVASRAGAFAMALGLVAFVVMRFSSIFRRSAGGWMSLALLIVTAIGAALAVLGTSQMASVDLLDADTSKLAIMWHMMRMFPAVAFFGCGRGAFASAFAAFRIEPGHFTYAYPENVLAQWLLEWGLPVALLGFASLAFALRPSQVSSRLHTASGAWSALLALFVQNLADLGSEVPGLVLGAVTCAAIVVGGTRGKDSRWAAERWGLRPRVVAVAGMATAGIAIVLVVWGFGKERLADERALYRASAVQRVSSSEMHLLARAAMLRHPAEPYLPFSVALRASFARDDDPLPWLEATLERGSVYGPAHLLLARRLRARSPSQARLEYRLAMEQAPELLGAVMTEVPDQIHGYWEALEVVPKASIGSLVLSSLAINLASRLPATATRVDEELRLHDPRDVGPLQRAAEAAVEDIEGELAPWCSGDQKGECVRLAMDASTHAVAADPRSCAAQSLLARALIASGDEGQALDQFAHAAPTSTDPVACFRVVAEMALAAKDVAHADTALGFVENAGCTDDDHCTDNLGWAAKLEAERGHEAKALALYRRACERQPDDTLLESAARLASRAGLHVEAAQDYERLAQRHPNEPRWTQAAAAERKSVTRGALPF